MTAKLVSAGEPIGIKTMKSFLARIFYQPPPERRLAAGFLRSERPKPVTDRRSTRSTIPSGYEISGLKPFILAASLLVWCGLNLRAQTGPTITNQPVDQVVTNGGAATFSVGVTGTGPFTYQWQFNSNNVVSFITTVAGNGTNSYSGDGGAANNASIYDPLGVAFDALGNLYIADYYNYRVRRVTANGIITTVAGNGSHGYSGDGGAATNAMITNPSGVALDAVGNLYIADINNSRIRKVDTNGIITSVAGNGANGYSGDGGAATNASLYWPSGVAFDAFGNLFIADEYTCCIRKVDPNGIITTVAGIVDGYGYFGDGGAATNALLYEPRGVAFDANGNLFIADYGNSRIRKVDTNGIITTVAGNGPGDGYAGSYSGDGGAATNATLYYPSGVAFDALGNLFIDDSANSRIRKMDANGIITTVTGNGTNSYSGDGGAATNASLYYPSGVAFDVSGNLFIADTDNNRIRKVFPYAGYPTFKLNNVSITNAGNYTVVITSPYGSVTSSVAALYMPPFITSQPASQIVGVGSSPSFSVAIVGSGPFDYEWYFAATNLVQSGTNNTLGLLGVTATNAGNYIVVVTNNYGSVTSRFATLTVVPAIITIQPSNQIAVVGNSPSFSVAVAGSGPLGYEWYFAGTNLVQSGTNNTFTLPNVSTTNTGNYTVVVTNSYGSVTSQVATLMVGFPPTVSTQPASQTNLPGTIASFNVAVNGTGPYTYQWQFNGTNLPNNIITTVAGNGIATYAGDGGAAISASLYYPNGVAFDAFGNLYIADSVNERIRRVDTNGIITTVAGKSGSGYSGDGGAGTNASLTYPTGVAFDAFGNLYIADYSNNRIRKVDTNGIIATVAGNGTNSYSGDGGAATNASLNKPYGVACDAFGNLYIADQANSRIRKVDINGIITTVAGNGTNGYSGDGGAATNASLYALTGLAFDAFGNLYIADQANSRIRKVDINGIITTVAGNGNYSYSGDGGAATNASLYSPYGVAFDVFGNLYIADQGNARIRKVDANGIITTVAGNGTNGYSGDGGAATNASLNFPLGTALDASGNLFIADQYNNRIRKVLLYAGYPTFKLNNVSITNAGNYTVVITSPYGSVTSSVAALYMPPFITSQPASQIVGVGSSPSFSVAAAGSGPFGYVWYIAGTNLIQSGTNSTLTLPSVSMNNAGNYTVMVTNNYGSVTSQVAILTVVPSVITVQPASQLAAAGSSPSFSVTVAGSGPFGYEWYFAATNLLQSGSSSTLTLPSVSTNNTGNYTVVVTNSYGSVTSQVATLTVPLPPSVTIQPACQTNLMGTAVNFSVAVAGFGPFTYQWQFDGTNFPNNIITTVAGKNSAGYSGDGGLATNASLWYPAGVAFDAVGNMYIVDYDNNRIRKMATNGVITTVASNLSAPYGVALDAAGNLYIAESSANDIRKVATNGVITIITAINAGGLSRPLDVALDAAGNLYIADRNHNRICKVTTNGIATAVAGNGSATYSGDGGAATSASLNRPSGVAFDAIGNLYITDQFNYRIRKVDANGIITTVAGNGLSGYSGDGGVATNTRLGNPHRVAFDAFGNMYIADSSNNRIRKVDANGIITTVAGNGYGGTGGADGSNGTYSGDGGAATNACINYPFAVTCDASGSLYIADSDNNRIRKVPLAGLPILSLPSVSATNAGNYTVVITSPYGSVTSSVAVLGMLPVITVQPQNASVVLASNATFSATASGPVPLNYQWLFGGANLAGATNVSYIISNAQPTNAGNYSAIVTNYYGSVTSSTASLTVTLPPIVPAFTQTNGSSDFGFTWSAIPGVTYQVQYKTNLAQADWINLGDPITTTNPAASILDSFGTDPERFYRVQLVQ
jgi:sugar lactone lactonase YvrE